MYAWTPSIVKYATEAGIDPQFLLSVLMIEVGRSQDMVPIDNLMQFGQWAADGAGIYGPMKQALGKGDSPPSLGWGNIQEDAFDETVAGHGRALGDVEWTDLMGDNDLSIKVTAYRLRDLQDIAKRDATPAMRRDYSPEEVAGAMYNIGTENFSEAVAAGNLGKLGNSYATAVRGNYGTANNVICGSGVWSCG